MILSAEAANAPNVAVVNQAFLERIMGGENPLGRRVSGGGITYEIIGVVKNIKSRTLGEDLRPVLFRSLEQSAGSDPAFLGFSLLVRTTAGTPPEDILAVRDWRNSERLTPGDKAILNATM